MDEYLFHAGVAPSGFQSVFECSLFNQPGFLQLQSRYHWLSFYILHKKRKEIVASIHFHIHEQT
ncbi:MAG: hypothetical protein L0Y35_08845, partial [Flammeovirgaceae bacterium]|nr:hypothetical protein [Flammeovirgaceae bacterium]